MKYEINKITPKAYQCVNIACPAVYEGLKEITSQEMECGVSACPSSHKAKREGKEVYLIVGKIVNPSEAGLEKKVGEGEALIEVPKGLIDDMGDSVKNEEE